MLTRISSAWKAVKRFYVFILPIRFSLLALLMLIFAFLIADQGHDILRALAENRLGRPWVRVVMLLVATTGLAFVIWFWSRHLLRYRPYAIAANDPCRRDTDMILADLRGWTKWLPRVLGMSVFFIEAAGFLLASSLDYHVRRPANLWWIVIWLMVCAALYWVIVVKRRDLLGIRADEMYDVVGTWKDLSRSTLAALVVSLAVELILFVWATIAPVSWWRVGVAAAAVLIVAVWVPLGSVVVALGETWRIPALTIILAVALLLGPCADNHGVRTLGPVPQRATMEKAFAAWEKRLRQKPQYSHGERIPVIVVATEGGGIRAAYWTAAVLTSLQDQIPAFADHCFAISGVSGGSLGALTFDSLLARRESLGPQTEKFGDEAHRVFGFDALSGTLAAMAQPDLLQRVLPFGFPDRAKALEQGWETGWSTAFPGNHFFEEPFVSTMQKHPALPLLLMNGTLEETGDRVITSNIRIHPTPLFRNAYDAYGQIERDTRLSTAALLSARFTYISPAGTLRDVKDRVRGHVVDGGYYEVSGGATAAQVVAFLKTKNVNPLVVYIDYRKPLRAGGSTNPAPFCPAPGACGPSPPEHSAKWANEILAPFWALLNTRDARGSQAVGDLAQIAGAQIAEFRLQPRFVPLPLGWVLSERAQDAIDWSAGCEGGNRTATNWVADHLGMPLSPNWRSVTARRAFANIQTYADGLVQCGRAAGATAINCNGMNCAEVPDPGSTY
ncbi:MAG TPA: patatin-like phospholipase family protein [Thermoanaerobaculia bacterium]|nr:patatin-like phospholipase family protein [Thermoanaerobaculia bacterium]